jgi:hypothetical protein
MMAARSRFFPPSKSGQARVSGKAGAVQSSLRRTLRQPRGHSILKESGTRAEPVGRSTGVLLSSMLVSRAFESELSRAAALVMQQFAIPKPFERSSFGGARRHSGMRGAVQEKGGRLPVLLEKFSVGREYFPVRVGREFVSSCPEWLRSAGDVGLRVARIRRNSLYFPCITGIHPRRPVRPRLPPHLLGVFRFGLRHC